ncbi:DAB2P protein, partial [Polyodon spathula]|nr:DAB2P protein [Polyodon spathula]
KYQQEVAILQDKLRLSSKKQEEYESRLKSQEEQAQKMMLEYQARLEEGEERLRRQQEDKELQMKGIISRYSAERGSGSHFSTPIPFYNQLLVLIPSEELELIF